VFLGDTSSYSLVQTSKSKPKSTGPSITPVRTAQTAQILFHFFHVSFLHVHLVYDFNTNKRISAFLSHLTSLNDSIVLGTSDIQAYRTRTLTSTHN